jgi:hypothetical protein
MKARLVYVASMLALAFGWVGQSVGMHDGSGF